MRQAVKVIPTAQARIVLARAGAVLQRRDADGSQVFSTTGGAMVRVSPVSSPVDHVRLIIVRGTCNC